MTVRTETQAIAASRAGHMAILTAIFMMGAALVFVSGFAGSKVLHDAAHDSRHGLSFPCH